MNKANVEEKKLVVQEKQALEIDGSSPIQMMQSLLDSGFNPDKIEKMIQVNERWEANEAKKAYTEAMAEFKANPPTILKDKTVGYTNRDGTFTGYRHASLGNVTSTINSELAKHGFSTGWKTEQNEDDIKVICTITHKMGHSESTSLSSGADNSGKKNSIQAIGSTITYLERYTLLALVGLATHDQDDDGIASEEIKYIDDKQKNQIADLLIETESDEAKFLSWIKADSLNTILAKDYKKAIVNLNSKFPEKK